MFKLEIKDEAEAEALISQNLTCHIAGIIYKVEEFRSTISVRQCWNCQNLGHSAKTCKPKTKCLICEESHYHKGWEKKQPNCANCKGPHVASWKGCPAYKKPRGGGGNLHMCHYFGYFLGCSKIFGYLFGYSLIFGYLVLVKFDFFRNNPDCWVLIFIFYTLLQNKWSGGVGRPPPIIFEGQNWPQQTIYHWKGDLMASRIHFKYWKNILISRHYEQFSRNDSAMAPQWLQKKFQPIKIWTYYI